MNQIKNNRNAKGLQWILTAPGPVSITKEVAFADVEHYSWILGTQLMLQVRWAAYTGVWHQYRRQEWNPGSQEQIQKVELNEWPGEISQNSS